MNFKDSITEIAIIIVGLVLLVNCLRVNKHLTTDCSEPIVGKLNTYVLIIVLIAMFMPISELITSSRCNIKKKTPGNTVLASLTLVLSIIILSLTSVMEAHVKKDDKCHNLKNAVRDNIIISVIFLVLSGAFLGFEIYNLKKKK